MRRLFLPWLGGAGFDGDVPFESDSNLSVGRRCASVFV